MYLAVGDSIEGVVLPVEIKNFQDLESAMYRALGYLVSKIQNLLDLHGFDVSIKGFCMGTDGFTLSLGYVSVENRELLVASTGLDGDQLWEEGGNPGTRLTSETDGVRIIRTLLSCSPGQLGVLQVPPPAYGGTECTYELQTVLGRGAFCTVFQAMQCPQEVRVIIKRECRVTPFRSSNPLQQLVQECNILRRLTTGASQCPHLPMLHDKDWMVSAAIPIIPMLPVGQPLERRCVELTPSQRRAEASVLYQHLNAGLTAAHQLSLCHRDVRPQNVIYNAGSGCYVVVDWNVAAAPGELMHSHRGGRPFWHDDVVEAGNKRRKIRYQAKHDLASARYVAWAFQDGSNFEVSWSEMGCGMVAARAAAVGNFLQT